MAETTMENEIVRHKLELLAANGERSTIEIAVGTPYSCHDDVDGKSTCWYCPVELKGIRDKIHDIGGDEAFEALVLGILFVRNMLVNVKRNGCRIVLPGTNDDYPIEEIFQMEGCQPPAP